MKKPEEEERVNALRSSDNVCGISSGVWAGLMGLGFTIIMGLMDAGGGVPAQELI